MANWFENGSLSFEVVKALPGAVIPAVVALFVAGITLRQYKVAKAKLNLDLFERRLKIFDSVQAFLSAGGGTRGFGDPQAFSTLFNEARFLFGEDIREYMVDASARKQEMAALSGTWKAQKLYPGGGVSNGSAARYEELPFLRHDRRPQRNRVDS